VIESFTHFLNTNETCGSWLASEGAGQGSTKNRGITVSLS